MIEARNIWKSFGDDTILEHLNFKVDKGEFITMVGTSGCGKSTLLNMLLGTVSPSRGELLLDGQPIPDQPNADRGIVFQQYSVFPHMTVLENVIATRGFQQNGLTGYLFGAKKRKATLEAQEMLKQVGLKHVFNRYPDELSGGMRQRLAIAQTLLGNPRILLLDEPFGSLDPGIRAEMHELVLSLWKAHNLTVFMITHDLKEGFYLGTRLWVLDKVRRDPLSPNIYGANITFDIPIGQTENKAYQDIKNSLNMTQSVLPQE